MATLTDRIVEQQNEVIHLSNNKLRGKKGKYV